MKRAITVHALALTGVVVAGALIVAPPAAGGGKHRAGPSYPDIRPSRIGLLSWNDNDDFLHHGPVGGIHAFSVASTSCNVGNLPADWQDGVGGKNPVLGANLYRYKDGRFEQIGMSWLKHAWCALSEPTCGTCQSTGCDTLGVGCADTYWSDLNAGPFRIGPRFLINPQGQGVGGVHNDIFNQPSGTIGGRLQVKAVDIIAGSRYFAEIQYATHDEPLDKRFNNASYREVNVTTTAMSGTQAGPASVRVGQPGIEAWKEVDPAVTIVKFEDVPGQGRFNLAYKVTDNGDGTWSYEYALHNQNSHRAAGAFIVAIPTGVNISNVGFHDVDYHSGDGEGYVTRDGTDWVSTVGLSDVKWETESFSRSANANALLWATMYNFRFVADTPPATGDITIGLWRPGSPDSVVVSGAVPSPLPADCLADLTGDDDFVDVNDLFTLLAAWNTNGPGANLAEPTDLVDVTDLFALLAAWGDCP